MSSRTIEQLREQSRSLRLIESSLCCVINAVEDGVGNNTVIYFEFDAGADVTTILSISEGAAGTYTVQSQDGASGTITFNHNGGGDLPFSSPLVLAIGDSLVVTRSVSTSAGQVVITGTF